MYRSIKKLCFVFICVLTVTSCEKDTDLPQESSLKISALDDTFTYSILEKDIITAVNSYREEQDLPRLSTLDVITFQAIDHNRYMIQHKKVSHDNFDKRYLALVKEIGARTVSENIGYGYPTANAVVEAWLDSEGHRTNIEGEFTHFGISVEQDEEGKNYFTHIFVKR